MNIDINRLNEIKQELESLKERDVLYISENGNTKYVIAPIELYDSLQEALGSFDDTFYSPQVKLVNSSDYELSYDEYERIKNQIMELVEKTLMPKPEKLN